MTTVGSILNTLPISPGIYQFFNKDKKVIYIGKSGNLKNRVTSYFNGNAKLNFAKKKMIKEIVNIEYIITNTEVESLILESTLIKKYQPKYNVLMKDDKNYLYIKITDEAVPKIITTRIKKSSGEYFGPYTSGQYVKNILKVGKKLFGFRSCNITFGQKNDEIQIINTNGTKIPCMDYYIKRCSAPCLLEEKYINEYGKNIEKIRKVLSGNFKDILIELENSMLGYAKVLNFEKAQELKEEMRAVKSLGEIQSVRDYVSGNYDVINYLEKYGKFYIGVIEIRESKITGYKNIEIESHLEETPYEILEIFLEKLFLETMEKKIQYIIPFEIKNTLFENQAEIPKIGGKLDMMKLCYKNIYEYACKKHIDSLSIKGFSKKTQKDILLKFGYTQINEKIIFECNDISHLSGTHTVASRSIIENGKTNPSLYRKFIIKELENNKVDDFASMREIMTRRIKELFIKKNIPDLIIIDGGKGQLSAVESIISDFKEKANEEEKSILSKLQIISLAKKEEEVFLPNTNIPLLLEKGSEELMLIQKIRDEAHRFAITFNRDSRIKSMKKNILESLPGFGPVTRKKILKIYGSVEKLKSIPREELQKHLTKNQIEILDNHGLL